MIYFIQNEVTKNIKIGKSNNPLKRLSSLMTGSAESLILLRVIDGDRAEEKKLHEMFSDYRIRGEWFRDNEQITNFINNFESFSDKDIVKFPIFRESHLGLTMYSEYVGYNCITSFNQDIERRYISRRFIDCSSDDSFVLLKHEPWSKIKPFHIETLFRYKTNPPRNTNYKLLAIYKTHKGAMMRMFYELNNERLVNHNTCFV